MLLTEWKHLSVHKLLGEHMSGYSYVRTQAVPFPYGRVVLRNDAARAAE